MCPLCNQLYQTVNRIHYRTKGGYNGMKNIRKQVLALVGVGILAMAMMGTAARAEEAAKPGEGHLYCIITALSGLDYFVDYQRAMKAAEEDFGVTCEFAGPTDYDMDGLLSAMEQAIAKKPVGMIMLGWEDTMTPLINQAEAEGIRVILTSQDLPNSDRSLFIGSSSLELGHIAGEEMAKLCDYKGKVAVLREVQSTSLADRYYGFEEIIAKYPDMELVECGDGQNDEQVAAQVAAAIMAKYPDLNGFLAADGVAGPAVVNAVREAGRSGETNVITFDRDDTILSAIEEGVVTCTLVSGTPLEVYSAIQMCEMQQNSSLSVSYDDEAAGVQLFPASIDPGCVVVDKENVKYFKRSYSKE